MTIDQVSNVSKQIKLFYILNNDVIDPFLASNDKGQFSDTFFATWWHNCCIVTKVDWY